MSAEAPESGAAHRSWPVWVLAGLAVVLRLPGVAAPAGADEAGFLQVAHQWSPGGGSLYGAYWVDRPPLLITLYAAADAAGGVVALRLLGCLAVVATVLLVARTAARLAGPRAGVWSALVAASLLVSPLLDAGEVNGELLSAPFVAGGVLAFVAATQEPRPGRAVVLAGVGGAAGVCALMVKQNVADVVVLGVVLLGAAAIRRTGPRPPWRALVAGAAAGSVVALAVLAGWTVLHGTSVLDVYRALYPFRLRAAEVVAAGGSAYARVRAGHLALAWLGSGLALLMLTLVVASRRRRDAAVVALALTALYATASIALGGGYWLHYLVELVVPVAVWTGVVVARGARAPRLAVGLVAVVAVVGAVGVAVRPHGSTGDDVGTAIAAVARPGDTLTTLYGDPQVNLAAGMSSPYPHLWSLPVKTLDPDLTALDAVLRGRAAPTWLVVTHDVSSWGLDATRTQRLVDRRYHEVGQVDGETIYLRDGVARASPTSTGTGQDASSWRSPPIRSSPGGGARRRR